MSDPSQTSQSTTGRLAELYRDGGISEVWRGVRDHVVINTSLPLHRAMRSVTLEVDDISVDFLANSGEAIWRGSGHGEKPVLRDFVDELCETDHVWDVGANIGSYALVAATRGVDVTAFEPGPQARADLLANAEHNDLQDRIDATPYALSDWTGQGVLLPAGRAGVRKLARDADRGDTVPVARGHSLDLRAPDVIKIDVEGAECPVLDGLGSVVEACRVCYVEVHDGVDRSEVVERLDGAGLGVVDEWDGIVKAERGDE